ncbi:NAD-dependent epimerase/dehydratase family protein [Hyphomicrobium sp.]|uniref:NAD-dependent epimerase/dehydratase family protein n=1 Tax=Hyphomicrobium sp. TaxID=82 RepID=UPI002E37107D|nr:NAD-dependent epimerase/dehydratase family protein [Hyphomicrobium sp.]HEX2841401.1 NAD-dependent epimerase/dehydratase family protein [Hyphomicrobium sp.]
MKNKSAKPVVLIVGAAGNLGRSIAESLADDYQIVGFDRSSSQSPFEIFDVDVASDPSVELALYKLRAAYGAHLASVIHLVAYFDFSGEANPLYTLVNVDGTRRLLKGLQSFEVEQFIYASTVLVHAPCRPGERIDESQPIGPRWAYPASKAEAEAVVRAEHGHIPSVIMRLAGVYDTGSMVPTLAHQIARIYERDFASYFYAGSTLVGQAMVHRADMLDAFRRTVERRRNLPAATELLIGEADAVGYDALQDELGYLIHGVDDWPTMRLPKPLAAAGVWAQDRLEPAIPDIVDGGRTPFIKPFMVALADDHYALDTERARKLIGWEPRHCLKDELPSIVAALKRDPAGWYAANDLIAPAWVKDAHNISENAESLRARHNAQVKAEHGANRWAHFVNIGLGTWLLVQPPLINVTEPLLRMAEMGLGAGLIVFASLAISVCNPWARWVCAGIGTLVMAAPFLFWTVNAAAYISDTLVGALIVGFAVCLKPEPGTSAAAALSGPAVPPGWTYNPSAWVQRLPIILMALSGVYVSRYLAAYQLGHVPTVWEPFFQGSSADPKNGTEEIITSAVAKAWPVSDAAVGAFTYLMEILTGLVGSSVRWRTMPWLVILFGLMIAPLGIVSIFFIIIQPVVIGTWSTIALFGAALILIQIPYSLDELIATAQFLRRRVLAGQNWLRVLLYGDTDDQNELSKGQPRSDEFDQSAPKVIRAAFGGGVNLPWTLAAAAGIGVVLMFSRTFIVGNVELANAHHVIGSLVLAVVSIAAAEVARKMRYLVGVLGVLLIGAPLWYPDGVVPTALSAALGVALIALCIPRGPVRERYGTWVRMTE